MTIYRFDVRNGKIIVCESSGGKRVPPIEEIQVLATLSDQEKEQLKKKDQATT